MCSLLLVTQKMLLLIRITLQQTQHLPTFLFIILLYLFLLLLLFFLLLLLFYYLLFSKLTLGLGLQLLNQVYLLSNTLVVFVVPLINGKKSESQLKITKHILLRISLMLLVFCQGGLQSLSLVQPKPNLYRPMDWAQAL